ncbi:MAG: hypothetical protein IJH34_03480, partial [Romboutsia sp.]|nr:hypothetical protein [Romboutsia sp.]
GKCPHCNTKTELGKLMNILKNRYNNEFTVLKMSNITKFNKMIKLMHKNCGAHFITTTEDIINEKMKCSNKECEHNYLNQDNKNIIQYQDDAINKKRLIIEKKLNNEFMISDKYNGNYYILLDVTHKKCGHTQYISIHNLLNRKTNVKCDECFRKTKEENFKKEIKDKYILLSKYHNRNTNIKVKRIECGHIYETKVSYVLNDKRYMCPKCKLENKIKYVKDLLIRKNYLNFELIKYTNDKDIILKHLDCKEHIKVNLKTIQNGKLNCKSCNKNKKLIEFKMKVFNLVGDEYEVVDNKYDNSKQLIRIKHKECGNTHEYIARNFLFKNVRCPRCSKKTRWNTKTFKNELYLLTKGEFLLKSEYINSSTDVTLRHTKCNKLFNAKPGRFLKRLKCPHCTTNVQKLSHNEYLERFDSIHSDRLVLLSQYKSMNENVEVLHKECGGIFEDNSRRFLVSKYSILCTKCNKYIKDYSESNKEKFEKKLYKKFNGEYSLVSKYNGIKNRMEIKHNKCGNTFSMIGESILKSNSPCKFCNKK